MQMAFHSVRGSDSEKLTMRSRIVSMRARYGFSSLFFTLNLYDIRSPLTLAVTNAGDTSPSGAGPSHCCDFAAADVVAGGKRKREAVQDVREGDAVKPGVSALDYSYAVPNRNKYRHLVPESVEEAKPDRNK